MLKINFHGFELGSCVNLGTVIRQSHLYIYLLEGDGPLVVESFEIIQTVQAAIQAAHTSNVAVVAA